MLLLGSFGASCVLELGYSGARFAQLNNFIGGHVNCGGAKQISPAEGLAH
jgi:hypothetical protein